MNPDQDRFLLCRDARRCNVERQAVFIPTHGHSIRHAAGWDLRCRGPKFCRIPYAFPGLHGLRGFKACSANGWRRVGNTRKQINRVFDSTHQGAVFEFYYWLCRGILVHRASLF